MTIDEAAEALKANNLEIDCIEMSLTQEASASPIVYHGKGYIRQDKDGVLNFKIFVSKVENTNIAQQMHQVLSNQSGRTYVDSRSDHPTNGCQSFIRLWATSKHQI